MSAARDLIVPGSIRTEVTTWSATWVTVQCGRCGERFEARHDAKTTGCKSCGRTCRLDVAAKAGPNVIPFRRRESTAPATPATA